MRDEGEEMLDTKRSDMNIEKQVRMGTVPELRSAGRGSLRLLSCFLSSLLSGATPRTRTAKVKGPPKGGAARRW